MSYREIDVFTSVTPLRKSAYRLKVSLAEYDKALRGVTLNIETDPRNSSPKDVIPFEPIFRVKGGLVDDPCDSEFIGMLITKHQMADLHNDRLA